MSVFETQGPPRAYFEVMDSCSNQTYRDGAVVTRLTYRIMGAIGESEEAVRKWWNTAYAEVLAWCEENDAFIIWRRQTEISEDSGVETRYPTEAEIDAGADAEELIEFPVPKRWRVSARFITSEPMPEEIWSKYEVKDCAQFPTIVGSPPA